MGMPTNINCLDCNTLLVGVHPNTKRCAKCRLASKNKHKRNKICNYCSVSFITTSSSVTYCSDSCKIKSADIYLVKPNGASCNICSKDLTGSQKKFCSPDCRYKGSKTLQDTQYTQSKTEVKYCQQCSSLLKGRQQKYCSPACKQEATYERIRIQQEANRKECVHCGEMISLSMFYSHPSTYDKLRPECKTCTYRANYDSSSTDKTLKKKDSHLKGLYGITLTDYVALLDAQNGVCAICKTPPRGKMLAVDHDHKTGLIRGLICDYDNRYILGRQTDPERLFAAADYLKTPPANTVFGEPRAVPPRKPRKRAPRKRRRNGNK